MNAAAGDPNNIDKKPACKYGAKCYRKNQDHLKNYTHPEPNKRAFPDTASADPKRPRLDDDEDNQAQPEATGAGPESSGVDSGAGTSASQHQMSDSSEEEATPAGRDNEEAEDGGDTADAEEEADLLPESPTSAKENIKQKFLVDMPNDFYSFLKFCQSLNSKDPQDALSPCGLRLAGPFLLLLGQIKPKRRTQDFYLTFCRYYFDPPEVQTVLCGDDQTGYHMAYFRDDPAELPSLVVANSAEKDGTFSVLGDNLFAAVHKYITTQLSSAADAGRKEALTALQKELSGWAGRHSIPLETRTAAMKQRDKRVLGKTLQGLGVVVPYDKKNDVGYREVPETHASLRKMFRKIVEAATEEKRNAGLDELQAVMQDAQFANDEGDPGMGLELGLDAFGFGGEALHSTVRHLLFVAYELLKRPAFLQILKAHLANRRKGPPVV